MLGIVHLGLRALLRVGATQRLPTLRPARGWENVNAARARSESLKLMVVPTGARRVNLASSEPSRNVAGRTWVAETKGAVTSTGGVVVLVPPPLGPALPPTAPGGPGGLGLLDVMDRAKFCVCHCASLKPSGGPLSSLVPQTALELLGSGLAPA